MLVRRILFAFFLIAPSLFAEGLAQPLPKPTREAVISVADQKLVVLDKGKKIASFKVSTSKFGVGDRNGSWTTPLGNLHVAKKIGDHTPAGTVFHRRQPTNEIIQPNAPGRDPIVSRILWLQGDEAGNRNAFERCIYIHGTAEERNIGRPASFGCIRMKSSDVIVVYDMLQVGSRVTIVSGGVRKGVTDLALARLQPQSYAAVRVNKTDD